MGVADPLPGVAVTRHRGDKDMADETTVLCVGLPGTARELARRGWDVITVDSVAAAGRTARNADCVVTDYRLPDGTGFDAVRAARLLDPDVPCLLYTAVDPDDIETGQGTPVVEFVGGDRSTAELAARIRSAVENQHQAGYPLPPDERARLSTVERVLPPPVPSLDGRAEEVAAAFDAPLARIGLVDRGRYRVLASTGRDARTVPRRDAPCTYTVLEGDVLVVSDLATDPRFAPTAPVVAGWRWYAGAPVVVAGHAVGTVALFDTDDRPFGDGDRHRLRRFADDVANEMMVDRAAASPVEAASE